MAHLVIVALLGGLLLAQQPKSPVTQTDLPPPTVSHAPSNATSDAAPGNKSTPRAKKEKEKAAKEAAEAQPGPFRQNGPTAPEKKVPAAPETEKPKPASNATSEKATTGKRVAAFWLIVPGKR